MRDANSNLTRWRFDNAGQLQAELQADGGIVTHQYDAFGNKVATIDARGNHPAERTQQGGELLQDHCFFLSALLEPFWPGVPGDVVVAAAETALPAQVARA